MGQLDFDYGFNVRDDTPTYAQACMGMLVCPHCGKAVMCGDIQPNKTIVTGDNDMDLSGQRSGEKRQKFENRDWIDSQEHLPAKGSRKFKVDGFRAAKAGNKKAKGAIGYVDLTCGKIKVVMSLRKGFTLDAFLDELGTNTDKWIGRTISLERGGSEGQYVNVSQ